MKSKVYRRKVDAEKKVKVRMRSRKATTRSHRVKLRTVRRPRISPESPFRAWSTVGSYLERKGYRRAKIPHVEKESLVFPGFWGQRWVKDGHTVDVMWMPYKEGKKWLAQTDDKSVKLPPFIEMERSRRR